MKSITTTYHGPTNYRGSRISASDSDKNRIILPYDDEYNANENHRMACLALLKKMKWQGKYYGGHTKNGMVWVCVDEFTPLAEL